MTQKSWFFKHRIMPKIIHHFFSLTFFLMLCVSSAFGAGYTCPTYREYTTCNEGYYLAYSYTGTSYSSIRYYSTPRAGNACRPCTDYDTYYNKPKGYYYCEGGTAAPVLNKFTITYDLNGGSGTTPDNETCTKGQTCTLNDGATTSFYRAGYVFKGWALTRTATIAFTSRIFNADDTVYAVWEACAAGMYKPSTANANATCSSCPELGEGFEYVPSSGLTSMAACQQRLKDISLYNENCVNNSGDATAVVLCQASENGWDQCAALPISANVLVAGPGAYLNNNVLSENVLQYNIPYANLSEILSQACIECSAGTYSAGGAVTSCSACPQPTDGFEYLPTTGNTSLTACKQGLKNPANINEFCEAASGTTAEAFKIQCVAASDDTWGNCIHTGVSFDAKPGSYVGFTRQSQSMPIEDLVENICIQCKDGTWSYGGGETSCSECPALRPADEQDGWKISSGGDGATSWSACYAYLESYPTNCASGSFKRMYRGNASAGYYGSEWFELEPLTANPGYMVQFEDGQTTAPACVECSTGTYSPGGDVHSCSVCPSGTYSSEPGASGCTDCPLPIQYAGVRTIWASIEKPLDGIDKCSLMFFFNSDTVEMLPDNMGAQSAIFCKYCDGDYGVSDTCGNSCGVPNQINFHCAPGYYQNMSPDDFGNKYTLLNMEDWFDKCAAPGVDYWADGTSRYQCPTGLTTIGYGAGADEAADCGRVLHFGNDTLYLRSVKKTDHALHVGINGDVFYGNMGTDLSKGRLKIKLGDTTYSVYDDSM